MSNDFTTEDIGRIVEQGDIRAFLRSRSQRPKESREFPEAAAPKSRADGRRVGAWPLGAHKPGCPLFGIPDGQCGCPTT